MINPDKTFRGKRLDQMTLSELNEMRDFVRSNGYLYGSHEGQMREFQIIDEHIAVAKQKSAAKSP